MLLVRTFLQRSPIHGLGVFADEDIRCGQRVWALDPRIDRIIEPHQVSGLPATVQSFLDRYAYTQVRDGRKVMILCADQALYMNHSPSPNLHEDGPQLEYNVAARDIRAGEELTCDYTRFDLDAALRLSPVGGKGG